MPYFLPPADITPEQIDGLLDRGTYTFALDIPPNFQRDLLAGRKPEIQVNIDATRMSQAFLGNSYIQNIVMGEAKNFSC